MNKDLMRSLQDRVVKIDRGGPESRVGKMLEVAYDHITVLTEGDGVVYYNTHHIKSLTENVKKGLNLELETPEELDYIKAGDFKSVLRGLKSRWVQINRGGPEMLEGVLEEANDDFIKVISNEEVVWVSRFHIRNISHGAKVEKGKSEKADKDGKKQNNQKNTAEKKAKKQEDGSKGGTY
ncbi:hypothetical protein [Siminovitchia acidinfaciens]|uniref:hypothetical protein n=1 Tax=Siminovitchia acidinfaciens TaxID=2321395 RepID=UPI0019D2762C|nr:hypothetical protein [Siminovitchia acidinfaciens]